MSSHNPIDVEVPRKLRLFLDSVGPLSSVQIFQGWLPDREDEEFQVPSISIQDGGPTTETPTNYVERVDDIGSGKVAIFDRVADIEYPVRLELYAEDREKRKSLTQAVRNALVPRRNSGFNSTNANEELELTLDKHHDAKAWVFFETTEKQDEQVAREGLAQTNFDLVVETYELDRTEQDKTTYTTDGTVTDINP